VNIFPIEAAELIVKDTGKNCNGRQLFELQQSLTFTYGVNGGGWTYTVPKGFVTDFASIPRIFWMVFPPIGKYARAAVIHDYLYRLKGCSRFTADAVFREAMYQLCVPVWKRILIYYAVRIFGGCARRIANTTEDIIDQFHTKE